MKIAVFNSRVGQVTQFICPNEAYNFPMMDGHNWFQDREGNTYGWSDMALILKMLGFINN